MHYFDSSALVKLVANESESQFLFEFIAGKRDFVSSALARVEVLRAIRRAGGDEEHSHRADAVLASLALIRIDDGILEQAAKLVPATLRSLDAIHLATAMALGGDLRSFVAYDRPLLAAAAEHGLEVLAPGLEVT